MKGIFLSFCPPIPTWGGAMTFHRHFIERSDFSVRVMTLEDALIDAEVSFTPHFLEQPAWWKRLHRTRLLPWIYGAELLCGQRFLNQKSLQIARDFKPEFVFTVAGSWHWTSLAAQRLAKQLQVPLVASFNDWYSYGWYPAHSSLDSKIEKRFKRFYQESDLALCTSEGMKQALGDHPNAHVWYPTGAKVSDGPLPELQDFSETSKPMTVFFGGNLGDWYGKMVESLVRESWQDLSPIEFRIFGSNPSWTEDFDEKVRERNIYRGRVDFDTLKQEAGNADVLLLPMGFDPSCAIVESTSFKTKFLDYLAFQRPILVWGPDYCSAIKVAQEFDSAECNTDISSAAALQSVLDLREDKERRVKLLENSKKMYEDRFNPEVIHQGLVDKIHETVRTYSAL